jgi:excisionase family DNA binding protein
MSALQAEISEAIEPLAHQIKVLTRTIEAMQSAAPQNLLTTEQAAERLHCTPETIRRKVRSGQLACKRIGTKMLFKEADLIK